MIALAWAIGLTVLFCVSTLATAGQDGFSGAAEAVDVIYVVFAAAGATFAAVLLLARAARRAVPWLLVVAAGAVAAWLTGVSGQVGPVLAAVVLLLWCWSTGASLINRLDIGLLGVGRWAAAALSMGAGMALLSFALLALALVGALTDVSIAVVLVVGGFTAPVHVWAWWRRRLRLQQGVPGVPLPSGRGMREDRIAVAPEPVSRSPLAGVESAYDLSPSYPPLRLQRGGGQNRMTDVAPTAGSPRVEPSIAELAALVAVLGAALLSFAVCLTPQVSFDALHYHFAMPGAFLRAGAFVERPDIIQSYFPLGLEMDFVAAFWLGGETTANLLHWAFLPMTAALLWSAGDRWCPRPAGAIAAVLFALMPVVVWEGTSASSDLAMTFFVVAGVYLIALRAAGIRALQQGSGQAYGQTGMGPEFRTALAAGLLLGLAVSFKLVSALYVAPVAIVFLVVEAWRVSRSSFEKLRTNGSNGVALPGSTVDGSSFKNLRMSEPEPARRAVNSIAAFAGGGILGGAPWLVLRWVQTGNPVFPLLNNVFHSDKWAPVNERFDLPFFGIGTSAQDFATFWWRATDEPSLFGQPAPSWFLGLPLLLALGVFVFLPALSRSRGTLVWTVAAFACALVWFFFSQYHRYGLPAFALLCLPAGFAVSEAVRRTSTWEAPRSLVVTGLVGTWFAACVVVSLASFSLLPEHFPRDVLLGRQSREEYRERWVPNYVAIRAFDRLTGGTDDAGAILGWPYNYFAANRLYDVIVPAELSPFRRIVEEGLPADETASRLIDAGVRWFVYDSNNPFGYEEWPPAWLAESVLAPSFVERHMEVAFEENGVRVYRIVGSK